MTYDPCKPRGGNPFPVGTDESVRWHCEVSARENARRNGQRCHVDRAPHSFRGHFTGGGWQYFLRFDDDYMGTVNGAVRIFTARPAGRRRHK